MSIDRVALLRWASDYALQLRLTAPLYHDVSEPPPLPGGITASQGYLILQAVRKGAAAYCAAEKDTYDAFLLKNDFLNTISAHSPLFSIDQRLLSELFDIGRGEPFETQRKEPTKPKTTCGTN